MQKHLDLTRQRLQSFAQKLSGLFYTELLPLQMSSFAAPGRIPFADASQANYTPVSVGVKLGPLWSTHWFRVHAALPDSWQGQEVHLLWDSSSEACVWMEGSPVQGLTGSFSSWADDSLRREFCITPSAAVGDVVEIVSNDPAAPHSIENLAHMVGTIPYELTCRLGPRAQRVLVD